MRSFDLPLVKCRIAYDLSRSKNWVISEKLNTLEKNVDSNSDPPIPHATGTSTSSALF